MGDPCGYIWLSGKLKRQPDLTVVLVVPETIPVPGIRRAVPVKTYYYWRVLNYVGVFCVFN
jgi:hypothetical protein